LKPKVPLISIVVPTLNEATALPSLLQPLSNSAAELIVADGGSDDGTVELAGRYADHISQGPPGRALQMNRGAALAQGEWLWFIHADSRLLMSAEAYLGAIEHAQSWGFFPLRLSGHGVSLRVIERFINCRSRLSRVATGDQGIFLRRSLFESLGGFAEQPLMEDIEMCKRLRATAAPSVSPILLQTSSRRWEQRGVARTVLLMWRLRLLYFLGASPQWLARQYR
jgi:rSAM/selenodomain-associated transferase 2